MTKIKRVVIRSFISAIAACALNAYANNQPAEELYTNTLPDKAIPELAKRGTFQVGVQTLSIVNPQQFNPNTQTIEDRNLTLEVWYPANLKGNSSPLAEYHNETRLGLPFAIQGHAVRDAKIATKSAEAFPLVVLSHGYTGYRTIQYYLGEHLASHGYIVAAIDHTHSTNAEVDMAKAPFSGFFSTLLNRSRDQQFVMSYFTEQPNFASQNIDKTKAGLVGYSMGGFGAVNTVGGCYQFTFDSVATFVGSKDESVINPALALLNTCSAGQPAPVKVDPKWQAMVAFAPWGGNHKLFNAESMAKIAVPSLYIAGDLDDISGYAGIQSLFEQSGSPYTYMLTYHNARHNIAPHPAPKVAYQNEADLGHYFEPAWSNQQLNTINQHFTLAMMDCHLKKQLDKCEYLALTGSSNEVDDKGGPTPNWKGFPKRYATGMSWASKTSNK